MESGMLEGLASGLGRSIISPGILDIRGEGSIRIKKGELRLERRRKMLDKV